MLTISIPAIALIMTSLVVSSGQQSPSTISAPCTTAPAQKTNSTPSVLDKWKKKLNDKGAEFGNKIGVPIPTTEEAGQLVGPKPAPCPPKPASAIPATLPTTVKLPPDTFVALHCNPMMPSPQGGNRQTTLTLPDPKDFAVPKANDFLADSVVPDTAAKTPCYLIKVDPKTSKSFIQQ